MVLAPHRRYLISVLLMICSFFVRHQFQCLHEILELFSTVSGQRVNKGKSAIVFSK
uniref:Uncharacterized protein n=1 Tax=Utricularia reniformis TaxID=192314 RepID=A0A1Y0B1C8_9LAMI|nr:hypothetical protein AEK19_MT0935 [Utricularia reniformis]ART31159.1 hypothetical protein AEK19_MT0935 [Utricularia reniformis]